MSSSTPKKVVLHADQNFIKHLYAEHDKDYNKKRSYNRPTYSFTAPSNHRNSSSSHGTNTTHQNNSNSSSHNNNNTSTSNTSTRQYKKTAELIHRRITKFYHLFDPMMNFLLMNRYAMYNKQHKIEVETMPVDYVMVVHLIDCVWSGNNDDDGGNTNNGVGRAQQQLLRIDKLEPRAVSDLNEKERMSLQHERELSSNESEEEFLLPHLVSYTTPTTNEEGGGYIWTSIRTNSYDFNPLIIGRVSQKALMGRVIAFAQGINEIAKGERQDLYEMIKKQMKEARRSKVSVPLRSLIEERGVACGGGGGANRNAASCHLWKDDESDNKENMDPNEKAILTDNNDDDCARLKELNTITKKRILGDKKNARKNVL